MPVEHDAGASVIRAGLVYFLFVFGFGFVFGVLRVLWLVPQLGTRTAELMEMPLMLAVIYFAARWLLRRHPDWSLFESLLAGLLALGLLVAAELALAWWLSGQGPLAYAASRDPVSGLAYLAGLLVFALAPMALRGRREL